MLLQSFTTWLAVALAIGQAPNLEWLPDGERLLVGDYWILDSSSGRYIRLVCSPPGCKGGVLSFAAGDGKALVVTGSRFATQTSPPRFSAWVPVPSWIRNTRQSPVNVAFWIAPATAFVQQFDPRREQDPACGIYDVADRQWRRPSGGCLTADFSYLGRVDRGPGDLLALHSSAEGGSALRIVRYDPAHGQSATPIKAIVLRNSSSLSVRFSPDGKQVALVTPCELETGSPVECADFESTPTWRLYAQPIAGGPIRLLRTDLPPGAVLDPLRDRFAWVRDHAICIGDPKATNARCFPLPR